MAELDRGSASLSPTAGGLPTVVPVGGATGHIDCSCPGISAAGSVTLHGAPGESLAGWALGYLQLKFIATDYSRYRGNSTTLGSVRVTRSNQILCRDTDEASPELWYDPISWGIHGTRGTRVLPAGTVVPPGGGTYLLSAGFGDAPGRNFDSFVANSATRTNNFIHHVDIGLQFCTMLTARDPAGRYHVLKHFYWNVRWESHFRRDLAGAPQVVLPADHLQLNIQRAVHSGVPNDRRFRGRELDATLPISNDVTRRPARLHPARDWSQG